MARRRRLVAPRGRRCPTGSGSTRIRWAAAARDGARDVRPVPAAGRRALARPRAWASGRTARWSRRSPSGPEVHRRDGPRGRSAGAHRAAGLSLQPHGLRFRAGRGARLLRRPRARERAGTGADAGRRATPGAPRAGGDPATWPTPRTGAPCASWSPTSSARALSRGVADAGVDPRRAQPPDHAAPERRPSGSCRATRSSPSPT